MVGANYIGGKRNAAIARSKDKAGRTQKRHFSKQRFDTLSKSLAGNSFRAASATKDSPDISLAHARGLAKCSATQTFSIPSPIHVAPCTPKSRSWLSASGSDIESRPLRLLSLLDSTDPFHLRAAMNRVLALPDLAGLHNRSRKRLTIPDSPSPLQRKKQKIDHDDNISTRAAPPQGDESSDWTEDDSSSFPLSSGGIADPSSDLAQDDENTGYPKQPQLSIIPRLSMNNHSSSNKTLSFSHSPPDYSSPHAFPRTPCSDADWQFARTRHCLDLSGANDKTPASHGNLFEYDDPWRAAGAILGLEGYDTNLFLEDNSRHLSTVVRRQDLDQGIGAFIKSSPQPLPSGQLSPIENGLIAVDPLQSYAINDASSHLSLVSPAAQSRVSPSLVVDLSQTYTFDVVASDHLAPSGQVSSSHSHPIDEQLAAFDHLVSAPCIDNQPSHSPDRRVVDAPQSCTIDEELIPDQLPASIRPSRVKPTDNPTADSIDDDVTVRQSQADAQACGDSILEGLEVNSTSNRPFPVVDGRLSPEPQVSSICCSSAVGANNRLVIYSLFNDDDLEEESD